jgi:hypothetical protein
LGLLPLSIQESPLPPPEPTPPGFTAGRATPTPDATPEPNWKYVTISLAIENHSGDARLVGVAGSDPGTTNLAQAVLTTRDGTRYKPIHSSTTLGLRTATSHALTTYPVLLRLPAGFRALAESAGSTSVVTPDPTNLTFKVPVGVSDYGTLSIPPLTALGPKSGDDDVSRGLRSEMAGFATLDLAQVSAQKVAFPFASAPPEAQSVGGSVSSADHHLTVSLLDVQAEDPADFEIRNRGWKQLTLSLQYRNDDSSAHAFTVAAWLFGDDGVVYTGDAPTIGDFGRALSAPEPSTMLLWDGRSAGADETPPGQSLEPRRATFVVPRALQQGVLVLAGDVDAIFTVPNLPTPPTP